jgi:transposase
MCEAEFLGITFNELEELKPLLSASSYQNLKKALKRQEESAPPLKGSSVYNHQYWPRHRAEYEMQNRILKDRLAWQRTLYTLTAMQNDFLSKENRRLKGLNEKLVEKNDQLSRENERLKNQLRKILGVSKASAPGKGESRHPHGADGADGADGTDGTDGTDSAQRASKKRGAPMGHEGRTRPIPDKINSIEIIPPPDVCPRCGQTDIEQTQAFTSKYIEDLVPLTRHVTQRRYLEGICSHCRTAVVQPQALEGPPVTIGVNLISLLTIMRQQLGATYRKMSRFCTETLQIPLSPSGVLGITNRLSGKLEPIYKGIEAALPSQEVLHGDETGWKMDGRNWYLWCLCNRDMVYFHPSQSRGAKIPKSILGENYGGILHADFYGAYNFVNKTQRCLVHLQRNIHDELEVSSQDTALIMLKEGIKVIINNAKRIKQLHLSQLSAKEKEKTKKEMDDILQRLTRLDSPNQKTQALIKRITKYRPNLLRFMEHPEVEYHNNRAERAIRPAVIFRKISFGNRTEKGAYFYAILASVIETYRLKNRNINQLLKRVLLSADNELTRITRELLDTS